MQTCQYLNIGKTLFYALQTSSKFGVLPIRLGRRTLYRKNELDAYILAGMPPRKVWQEQRKQLGFY